MSKAITVARFRKGQEVVFLGGSGVVKGRYLESGHWMYAVQMQMGPEPEVGRIGYETTVIMPELDLTTAEPNLSAALAAA